MSACRSLLGLNNDHDEHADSRRAGCRRGRRLPTDLSDEEILSRLVALNHDRAEEERRGVIRWLRPEFQNREGIRQTTIATETEEAVVAKPAKVEKLPWPGTLSEQAAAVQGALVALAAPASEVELARQFHRANKQRIAELLETLASLGKARELDDGRYLAV